MKITDPEVIRNGEKDLIASVQQDLDLDTVRNILKERMAVARLSSSGGQIVVHNNEIAFRLDFEVNMSGSLLFDRQGNLIQDAGAEQAPSDPAGDMTVMEEQIRLPDEPDPGQADPGFGTESGEVQELSIDLPEYDLEDDLDDDPDNDQASLEMPVNEELELEDLDDEPDSFLSDDEDMLESDEDTLDDVPGFEPVDDLDEDLDAQDLDDDINDILKESREFWEQKKDS